MAPPGNNAIVCPPVPCGSAVVRRFLIGEGDRVAAGAPVCVVDVEGSDHTLKSPFSGSIATLEVAPGATVEPGTVLMTLTRLASRLPAAAAPRVPGSSGPPLPAALREAPKVEAEPEANVFAPPAEEPQARVAQVVEAEPKVPAKPQYEFQPEEEVSIGRAGNRLWMWGLLAGLVSGVCVIGIAALWFSGLVTGSAFMLLSMSLLPLMLVHLATCYFYLRAGGQLRAIVATEGSDVDHLMQGVSALTTVLKIEAFCYAIAGAIGVTSGLIGMVF